jgi:selenocysteine lyase/cysteine desulfurase
MTRFILNACDIHIRKILKDLSSLVLHKSYLKVEQNSSTNNGITGALEELETSILGALTNYSNVHRGSGQLSLVSTFLYEEARKIVLEHLHLSAKKYQVIFCSPLRAIDFIDQLKPGTYHILSSVEIGLPIGVRAVAVLKKSLPVGRPLQPGGGAARLIAPQWVVWASAPDKFEAGTPAIINIIAFVKALQIIQKYGEAVFSTFVRKVDPESILEDELLSFKARELLDRLRETLIGYDVKVPSRDGLRRYINLDNAASTRTFHPVFNAFLQALQLKEEHNISVTGRVREICCEFLNAPSQEYDVIFTSNATEAINLAAENLRKASGGKSNQLVLNTILEHSSNDLPWRDNSDSGTIRLTVDHEGFIDLAELDKVLFEYNHSIVHGDARISIVAISGASNVLGTCNDVARISSVVHKYGALLLVDAAQLIAHRRIDVAGSGIDFLAFSGHKVYAPFGAGALVAGKQLLKISPEKMKKIRNAGEENFAGIAALGKSLILLQRIGMELINEEEQALTNHALTGLASIEGLKIFGIDKPDSDKNRTGVIPFFIKSVWPDKVSRELAARGIGVRYGCHCAHMLVKHLLKVPPSLQKLQHFIAVAFPRMKFPGVVRISFGIENSMEDVDILIRELKEIVAGRKEKKPDMGKQMEDYTKTVQRKVFGAAEKSN